MANSFLSLDFGAGTLKVAEFELNEAGTLLLKRYGIRSLGLEGSQESAREVVLRKAIQELFAERGFGSRRANVCAPGFHVFSKFVKLPPVDTSKVSISRSTRPSSFTAANRAGRLRNGCSWRAGPRSCRIRRSSLPRN